MVAITIGVSYFVYQQRKDDKETKNQQNPATTTAANAANAANAASDDEYYYTDVGSFEYYETPSANVPKLKFDQSKSTH